MSTNDFRYNTTTLLLYSTSIKASPSKPATQSALLKETAEHQYGDSFLVDLKTVTSPPKFTLNSNTLNAAQLVWLFRRKKKTAMRKIKELAVHSSSLPSATI